MIERMVRAIRLDWTVFGEIAGDRKATKEAAIIVAIVTFLSAVGSGIAHKSFVSFIVAWLVAILVGWLLWAVITYFVGTAFFKGKTDIPSMMRVLGYASAPNLLGLFSFIPCVGWLLPAIGWFLALVAGVLAVREAMDFDTGNAIVTVFISWIIAIAIRVVFWVFIG
jgi:hypothetical protein